MQKWGYFFYILKIMSKKDHKAKEKKEIAQMLAKQLRAGTYFAEKEEDGYAIFSKEGNVKIGSLVINRKYGSRIFKSFVYEEGMEPKGIPTEFTTSLLTPVWDFCYKNLGPIEGFAKPEKPDLYGKRFWKSATREEQRQAIEEYIECLDRLVSAKNSDIYHE